MAYRTDPPISTTIAVALVDELRSEITSGALAPGSAVRQAEVAARYGVSTTPVRAALAVLEREGLLVGSPHRGRVVFRPTIDDLRELYDIRIPLEALATEKAVPNLTAEDLSALDVLLARMEEATGDRDRYMLLNREFHSRIYHAADRPRLERTIADMRDASGAYLRIHQNLAPDARDTQMDHLAILVACKARSPTRAAKAMARHLTHTVDRVARGLAAEG